MTNLTTSDGIRFVDATAEIAPAVGRLLAASGLPVEGAEVATAGFIAAVEAGQVIGTIGLEVRGRWGLLRSLAVAAHRRGRGIARQLCERLFARAGERNIEALYLLTTTADRYFERLGFQPIDRAQVPEEIRRTAEFTSICPTSARVYGRRLDDLARYFPRDRLALGDDLPGARCWAVSLERTTLSYFDVAPGTRFPRHQHDQEEQITLVLEGELWFEFDERTVRVGAGEVVAVPRGVAHAVFTKELPARAVDAWSPARRDLGRGGSGTARGDG